MGHSSRLLSFLFCFIFGVINGDLVHNRPSSGIGSFLLSHDDNHKDYNDKTLMVTFDLKCLNFDTNIQNRKIKSIINHFDGCLDEHDTTRKHFQHDRHGISFLKFSDNKQNSRDGLSCLTNHKNNNNFDYNIHCVHMFSYEPLFYLNGYNDISSNYTIYTNSSQYNCETQATDASSLPSGWAWGLDQIDSLSNDNLFTYPIVNS